MRELLKSMMRFSWAMPLFGASNIGSLIAPAGEAQSTTRIATALDLVTQAAQQQMGEGLRAVFQTGDRLQSGMLDVLSNPISGGQPLSGITQANSDGNHPASYTDIPLSPATPGEIPYGGLITSTDNMHTEGPNTLHIRLGNTTQGPFWPPAAQVDANGDFILVGSVLTEIKPGTVVPVPRQAVLVSKDTVPPLDGNGKEDFSNLFGAPYKVIRPLDLTPGSPDLDMVIHSVSWGPFEGDWGGGGPRMPMVGENRYNLNSFHTNGITSPEIFPSASQRFTYTRPSFPLHKVPIPGFQGDQIAYDVDTGKPYTPRLRGGANCPPDGCEGEDPVNFRREEPITLGEWLKAEVWVTITLCNYRKKSGRGAGPNGVYTAARFDVQARNLLPNSFYAVMFIRRSQFEPSPLRKIPDSSVLPNIMIADWEGKARSSRVIPNPFPDPLTDSAGLRIIGIGIGFKPDYAVWGAYPFRLNPGADIHAQVTTFADGARTELTSFITEAP